MLDEAIDFLESRRKDKPSYKYEIIVVSDGSKDKTVEVAESYVKKYGCDKVRCLELIKNRGKGGAVRLVSWKCTLPYLTTSCMYPIILKQIFTLEEPL